MIESDDVFLKPQTTSEVDPSFLANDLTRNDGKPIVEPGRVADERPNFISWGINEYWRRTVPITYEPN